MRHQAIIISHTKDLDGLASAAIALRERPGSKLYLVDYAEKYVDSLLGRIGEFSNHEEAIISDIGCNRKTIDKWAVLAAKLKESGMRVFWLDHHQWDEDCVKKIKRSVDVITHGSQDICAAEIVKERIGTPGDLIEERLALLAHDSDFNVWREPLSSPLSRLISYYHYIGGEKGDELKRRLTLLLANGIFWTFEFDAQLAEYTRLLEHDKTRLISNARVIDVKGYKVVVSVKGAYSGTDAANLLFKEAGGDIAVLVSSKGHVSIRSRRSDVNTKIIGEALGGGGHLRYAAGGTLEDRFPEPKEDQLDEIARYVAELLSRLDFKLQCTTT